MGANFGTTNLGRITLHAPLPIIADAVQGWSTPFLIASVLLKIPRAGLHLRHDVEDGFFRLFVHISADCSPETVDDVYEKNHEKDVEKELGVERENVGQVRMSVDEAKQRGHKGWPGTLLIRGRSGDILPTPFSRTLLQSFAG